MASELIVQTIQGPSSGANANKVIIPSGHTLDASGGTLVPSAGQVVQVKSVNTQSHQSHSTTTFGQFSGLDISITPTSATSKILISYNVFVGNANDDNYVQFVVRRSIGGGSNVDVRNGASVGSASLVSWANNGPYTHAVYEVHSSSWQYLDSPATTSQIDYKLFGRAMATTARTMYLNRPSDVGDANRSSTTSTVTVMEIKQ